MDKITEWIAMIGLGIFVALYVYILLYALYELIMDIYNSIK